MNLNFEYDAARDVLTVEGLQFAGVFFRQFNSVPLGAPIKILSREDGVLIVAQMEPWDRDWALKPEESPDAQGFTWRYEMRNFHDCIALCGCRPDADHGQVRYGVIFHARRPDLMPHAKALVRKRIAEGKGIYGDDMVEGNEESIA